MTIEQIRKKINADSLDYLSLENLRETLGGNNFCMGCFTGKYPIANADK